MPKSQSDLPEFHGFQSPNYTQVPDELIDHLMVDLSGAELKVVLYIIRRTFGFKRESDNISLSQMLNGLQTKEGRVLDRGVGLSKKTLLQAVRSLEEKRIILTTRRQSLEKGNEPTTYQLNMAAPGEGEKGTPPLGEKLHQGVGRETPPSPRGKNSPIQETVKRQTDVNPSRSRKASPKTKQTEKAAAPDQPPQPTGSHTAFPDYQSPPQPDIPPEHDEAASPAVSPSQPPRLTRTYLTQAREKPATQPAGMTAISNLLPSQQPKPPRASATESWQVLVDLLADIGREFRDEAQLSESVSRAYNLMGKAKITDIGVFTAKIYEARAITKSRYGTITRRMPYFFSVLADVCGLRAKGEPQPPSSG